MTSTAPAVMLKSAGSNGALRRLGRVSSPIDFVGGLRGEEEPKHRRFNWSSYFHAATVLGVGIRLPLRRWRIWRCYKRDECPSLLGRTAACLVDTNSNTYWPPNDLSNGRAQTLP